MPKLAEAPTFATEEFYFEMQRRKRVVSATVTIDRGWPAATTARAGAVPRSLRRPNGEHDLRIHNTEAGHLLALEFGGPDVAKNLVPMWGRFNKHGAWKRFEGDLGTLVGAHGRVRLEVKCDYLASIDERIPKVFRITATLLEGVGSPKMWIINHIPPRPRPEEPDRGFADLVRDARMEMNSVFPDGFFIEDHFERTMTGQVLRLPVRDPELRPYAVLDYMALGKRIDFPLLREVDNGKGFAPQQREWILALNRLDNEGLLVTDIHEDFAAVSTDSHTDSYGNEIWHGSYIVDGFPLGVLMETGGDQAPEVDHVIPESRNGCNAFSNAQVVSRAYNQWKSARISDEDSIRLSSMSRKSLRLSTGVKLVGGDGGGSTSSNSGF